jgi:hypothetical protein
MLTYQQGLTISFPFTIFAFYQWTLKDSWLSLLFSILAFLVVISLISYLTFVTIRIAHRSTPHALYSDAKHSLLQSTLYAQSRAPRYYYFILPVMASFCKAICISFANGNGEVQIILITILEGVTVIACLILRPCTTKGGDVFLIFLASARLLCTTLTIAFVERLELAPIPRVVIGLVIAAIFSAAVIVSFINIIAQSRIEQLWKHDCSPGSAPGSSNGSMLEKGELCPSKSSAHVGRPNNPTPEQSIALDPCILQPYPISPSTTATEQRSHCSRDSHTITINSPPSRQNSSSSSASQHHEPPSPISSAG